MEIEPRQRNWLDGVFHPAPSTWRYVTSRESAARFFRHARRYFARRAAVRFYRACKLLDAIHSSVDVKFG